VLLQLLDEGRLTDSHGRTVDFTNCVIILTSNVGSEYLLDVNQDDQSAVDAAHAQVMKMVRAHFAPEFLNRLSAICMFNSLGPKQLEEICYKSMREIKRRLATQGVRAVLESSGARAILAESYDPNYGARPVERYLESTVVTELSKMLISGELQANKTVHIEAVDVDEISIDERDMPYKKLKPSLVYRVEDTTLAEDIAEVEELSSEVAMEE
jgi:ATP-dependent Clp protease ATP-binding subunit ClpB